MDREALVAGIVAEARYVLDTASQVESYREFDNRAVEELASVFALYAEMRRKTEVVRGLLFSGL